MKFLLKLFAFFGTSALLNGAAVEAHQTRVIQYTKNGKIWLHEDFGELLAKNPLNAVVFYSLTDEEPSILPEAVEKLLIFQRLLNVYMLKCSMTVNKKSCSDYHMTSSQGVRFFENRFQFNPEQGQYGTEIPMDQPIQVVKAVTNLLPRRKLPLPAGSPNFRPINHDDDYKSLFAEAALKHFTHVVLVEQIEYFSKLGRDTILALLSVKNVIVRIVKNPHFFDHFGLTFKEGQDKLGIIDRTGRAVVLHAKDSNGLAFAEAVISHLKTIGKI